MSCRPPSSHPNPPTNHDFVVLLTLDLFPKVNYTIHVVWRLENDLWFESRHTNLFQVNKTKRGDILRQPCSTHFVQHYGYLIKPISSCVFAEHIASHHKVDRCGITEIYLRKAYNVGRNNQ